MGRFMLPPPPIIELPPIPPMPPIIIGCWPIPPIIIGCWPIPPIPPIGDGPVARALGRAFMTDCFGWLEDIADIGCIDAIDFGICTPLVAT